MGRNNKKDTKDKKDTSDGSGSESEAEYVVEKIVNRRVKNGKVMRNLTFILSISFWAGFRFCFVHTHTTHTTVGWVFLEMEGLSAQWQYLGTIGQFRLPGTDQSIRGKSTKRNQGKRKGQGKRRWGKEETQRRCQRGCKYLRGLVRKCDR